jgi:predicted TIM-barrel fold metal-dependent hydrolase
MNTGRYGLLSDLTARYGRPANRENQQLTIDTHHHILPDFFWRETNDSHAPVGGLAPQQWSKEAMTSFMDDAGIHVAVMSVSTPGVHLGDSGKARSLARRCNEFAAELVHTRPERFAGFACMPLPDIDASLQELSYAIDVLRLDGLVLFTNSRGVYLGDATLEPVFEELERRKAVVFVHPNPSPDAVAHSLGLPDNLIDFPMDTNRAVAQMHYTNRFARTPNVKYIFSHAGGSIPYLAARFAIIDEMGFIKGAEQRGSAADIFRRLYWDTALSASAPVFRMLRDVAGLDQVLFGTDFPYLRRDLAVNAQQRILQSSELNPSEKHAILAGNAARLFPRLHRQDSSGQGQAHRR